MLPPVLLQHAVLVSYAVLVDLQLLTQESIVTIIEFFTFNLKILLGFGAHVAVGEHYTHIKYIHETMVPDLITSAPVLGCCCISQVDQS